MRRFATLLALALFALTISGCGQKGPLYLPQPSEQQQAQ